MGFRVRSGVLESQSVALSGRTGNPRGREEGGDGEEAVASQGRIRD